MHRFLRLAIAPAALVALVACNKHVDPYAFDAGASAPAPSAPETAAAAPAETPSAPAEPAADLAPLNSGAAPKPAAPQTAAKPKASAKPAGIPECELAKSSACANPSGPVLRANCATAKSTCLQKGGKL